MGKKEKYKRFKEILRREKSVPCSDCGQTWPPDVMHFDHVKGPKIANVASMYSYSETKIYREIAKCEVVCANCHTMRTTRRGRNFPPRGKAKI